MRFVYNTHFHWAPRGPTSTPISPMTLMWGYNVRS
jgi:hypothetical protein